MVVVVNETRTTIVESCTRLFRKILFANARRSAVDD